MCNVKCEFIDSTAADVIRSSFQLLFSVFNLSSDYGLPQNSAECFAAVQLRTSEIKSTTTTTKNDHNVDDDDREVVFFMQNDIFMKQFMDVAGSV